MNLLVESFGYAASVFVAISLLMVSLVKLRILNLIGCLFFVVYGVLLGAWPIVVTNGFIAGINLVFLYKMFRQDITRFNYQPLASTDVDRVVRFLGEKLEDCNKFYPFFHPKMIGFAFSHEGFVYCAFRRNRLNGISVLISLDSLINKRPEFWLPEDSTQDLTYNSDSRQSTDLSTTTTVQNPSVHQVQAKNVSASDSQMTQKQLDFVHILDCVSDEKKTNAFLMPADYLAPKYRDLGVVGQFHKRLIADIPTHIKRILCPVYRSDAKTRRYFQRNGYEKLISQGDYTVFELDLEDLRTQS